VVRSMLVTRSETAAAAAAAGRGVVEKPCRCASLLLQLLQMWPLGVIWRIAGGPLGKCLTGRQGVLLKKTIQPRQKHQHVILNVMCNVQCASSQYYLAILPLISSHHHVQYLFSILSLQYYHATLPFIIMANILNILYIMCNTSSYHYYYYYPFIKQSFYTYIYIYTYICILLLGLRLGPQGTGDFSRRCPFSSCVNIGYEQ